MFWGSLPSTWFGRSVNTVRLDHPPSLFFKRSPSLQRRRHPYAADSQMRTSENPSAASLLVPEEPFRPDSLWTAHTVTESKHFNSGLNSSSSSQNLPRTQQLLFLLTSMRLSLPLLSGLLGYYMYATIMTLIILLFNFLPSQCFSEFYKDRDFVSFVFLSPKPNTQFIKR